MMAEFECVCVCVCGGDDDARGSKRRRKESFVLQKTASPASDPFVTLVPSPPPFLLPCKRVLFDSSCLILAPLLVARCSLAHTHSVTACLTACLSGSEHFTDTDFNLATQWPPREVREKSFILLTVHLLCWTSHFRAIITTP